MTPRNPILDAALDECRKAAVEYRVNYTAKRHLQLFVAGSTMVVTLSSRGGGGRGGDWRAVQNARKDVRRAIALRKPEVP